MTRFNPLKEFNLIADKYLAPIEPLISVEQVNNWCKNKTHGKIDKILDELEPNTLMIILNAVYFKGEWEKKFLEYFTNKLPFYYNLGNEEIKVDTMSQIDYTFMPLQTFTFYYIKYVLICVKILSIF